MTDMSVFECVNASRDSLSDAFTSEDSYAIVLPLVILFLFVVGLPWNLLVIVTIVRQRLYTQPTILLLLNLLIADFLMLLVNFPLAVSGLAGEFMFGNSDYVRCQACIAMLFPSYVLYFTLLLTITLLTLDRFFFIYRALYYEKLVTVRKMLAAIAMAWILSVLLTILYYKLKDDTYFTSSVFLCFWNSRRQDIVTIVAELIPYLLGLLFNVSVIFIAVKNIRAVYKVQETPRGNSERRKSRVVVEDFVRHMRNKKELHLMQVFSAIVLSNTVAWLPFVIVAILVLTGQLSMLQEISIAYAVSLALFMSQVVLHPFVETAFIREVREPLMRMVKCAFCFKKRDSPQNTSLGKSDISHGVH